MPEPIGGLAAVGAFVVALGIYRATQGPTPADSLRVPRLSPHWREPPVLRQGAGVLLAVTAFVVQAATGEPLVWGPLLVAAGAILAHAGLKVACNLDGWGDVMRRVAASGNGLRSGGRYSPLWEGVTWTVIGLVLLAAGVANIVVRL